MMDSTRPTPKDAPAQRVEPTENVGGGCVLWPSPAERATGEKRQRVGDVGLT